MRKLLILFTLTIAFVSAALCQAEAPSICPKIAVVGPSGITRPGDFMVFATNPPLNDREGLSFHWTVSAGTITKVQGTRAVEVGTTREMNNSNVTATVEISGLPKECPRTASETGAVSAGFYPALIDEFGKLPSNDVRYRLDSFLAEVTANKDQIGTIILQFSNGASQSKLQKRIRLIKDHIFRFRRFPAERIVIFLEPNEREYTKLYRLPPDVADAICNGCKREPTK